MGCLAVSEWSLRLQNVGAAHGYLLEPLLNLFMKCCGSEVKTRDTNLPQILLTVAANEDFSSHLLRRHNSPLTFQATFSQVIKKNGVDFFSGMNCMIVLYITLTNFSLIFIYSPDSLLRIYKAEQLLKHLKTAYLISLVFSSTFRKHKLCVISLLICEARGEGWQTMTHVTGPA